MNDHPEPARPISSSFGPSFKTTSKGLPSNGTAQKTTSQLPASSGDNRTASGTTSMSQTSASAPPISEESLEMFRRLLERNVALEPTQTTLECLKTWLEKNKQLTIQSADDMLSRTLLEDDDNDDEDEVRIEKLYLQAIRYAYEQIEPLQALVNLLSIRSSELYLTDARTYAPIDPETGERVGGIDVPMRDEA
ncbi:hypothetical protein LTR86_010138 [Recurvomyces mirabilis]|nr:hypothetical protein LTR86_010138 [Recurvomyces mirabilis]